jgi:hypothetical protein
MLTQMVFINLNPSGVSRHCGQEGVTRLKRRFDMTLLAPVVFIPLQEIDVVDIVIPKRPSLLLSVTDLVGVIGQPLVCDSSRGRDGTCMSGIRARARENESVGAVISEPLSDCLAKCFATASFKTHDNGQQVFERLDLAGGCWHRQSGGFRTRESPVSGQAWKPLRDLSYAPSTPSTVDHATGYAPLSRRAATSPAAPHQAAQYFPATNQTVRYP